MTENRIKHALGGVLLFAGILTLGNTDDPGFSAVSWLLMGAGAYLITGALFAIVFTIFALSTALVFTGQASSRLHMVLMVLSGTLTLYLLVSRFVARIRETRVARWQNRQTQSKHGNRSEQNHPDHD